MSTDVTVQLQRKAEANRDSNGDVAIAAVWGALYLFMIVGSLVANGKAALALILFAAILVGCGVLGWRRNKKPDRIPKSRALAA